MSPCHSEFMIPTSPESLPSPSSTGCAVCGDRVNSKRYGVPACLGCIVFFRRAIVKNLKYKCLRNGNCEITNEYRCSCRFCRLQKCLQMGMKPEAIQRRDIVGPRKLCNVERTSSLDVQSSPEALRTSLEPASLLVALVEFQKQQVAQHMFYFASQSPTEKEVPSDLDHRIFVLNRRRARAHDVNVMLKLCLSQAAEWGKKFEPYQHLSSELKQNILAEYGFAFLLIDQGFKTAREAEEGFWLLQNDTFMHSDYFKGLPEEDAMKGNAVVKAQLHQTFVTELLDCVSTPFRNLQIDETECAALKTVLLLTPSFSKRAIYSGQEETVFSLHSKCMDELMEHCEKKLPRHGAERFGEILLLISSIRCGVKALYNQTRVSDVFNLMQFDPLVRDTLLS